MGDLNPDTETREIQLNRLQEATSVHEFDANSICFRQTIDFNSARPNGKGGFAVHVWSKLRPVIRVDQRLSMILYSPNFIPCFKGVTSNGRPC